MTPFGWHGAMMVVAWLVLLPAGVLIARFFKVRKHNEYPRVLDDEWWWDLHRLLQSAGAALAALAAWWVYDTMDGVIDWPATHVQFGVAALALLALQIVSPMLRGTKGGPTDRFADPADPRTWRGDHYDMTRRRRLFEAWHKTAGYVAVALAACAAWTGIDAAGLPAWWRAGIVLLLGTAVALFARFTFQARRVDTWKAIWGPGES